MSEANILKIKAEEIRLNLLDIVYKAKAGHIGGGLSSVNVLTVLYHYVMNVDSNNLTMPDRDRFVMSKGHCAEALYCTLESAGFITKELLHSYGMYNSRLAGHPTIKTPGVEINSGALGHGLSVGTGMALAAKMDNKQYRTYVLMGDGEQGEGSVYEAAMAASHYKLGNLVAIIDRNGLQITAPTEKVMSIEPIKDKWEAFGWNVLEMNGDDIQDIVVAFDKINYSDKKPHLIISKTTKGKGISYMENILKWHHGIPTKEEYEAGMQEIKARIADLKGIKGEAYSALSV